MKKGIIIAILAAMLALSSCGFRSAPVNTPEPIRGGELEYVRGVYIVNR